MNNYGKLKKVESICKEGLNNHCTSALLEHNIKVNHYDVRLILTSILNVISDEQM